MKTIQLLLFIFVGLVCTSTCCKDDNQGHGDDRLTIFNNSNDTIVSFLQFNFPDTSLLNENAPGLNNIVILPHSKNNHLTFVRWETLIPENNSKSTLMIFINSLDTIQKYTWPQIQQNYNI